MLAARCDAHRPPRTIIVPAKQVPMPLAMEEKADGDVGV